MNKKNLNNLLLLLGIFYSITPLFGAPKKNCPTTPPRHEPRGVYATNALKKAVPQAKTVLPKKGGHPQKTTLAPKKVVGVVTPLRTAQRAPLNRQAIMAKKSIVVPKKTIPSQISARPNLIQRNPLALHKVTSQKRAPLNHKAVPVSGPIGIKRASPGVSPAYRTPQPAKKMAAPRKNMHKVHPIFQTPSRGMGNIQAPGTPPKAPVSKPQQKVQQPPPAVRLSPNLPSRKTFPTYSVKTTAQLDTNKERVLSTVYQ